MSESYVNKPYSEQELEQKLDKIRGDLSKKVGNWADRIQVSLSFTPKIERIEGEQWSEDSKRYVMKDGIKQSLSLMQEIRMPWHCPKCSKSMNHRFDRKFFYLRNWCYNCNVEWEGQLRLEGKWEEFERRMLRENEKSFIRDKIEEMQAYIKDFTVPTAYFEDGRFERLAEVDMFQDKFKELEDDVEFLLRRMDVIRKEEEAEELAHAT